MGVKTRSCMTEPSWSESNGILHGERRYSYVAELVVFVSCLKLMFHEYGDEQLQIGKSHAPQWLMYIYFYYNICIYIYIILYHYISIHSHNMFNYIYFGLFRIATSQECLDIWNSSHLDPGGGGCQWPPFIHGFMSSNPWGQTSSGSPKLKQRIWRFRLPSKIFCCSSWPIMLLPVVSCLFQGLFCFSGNPIPEESERAGTWCPRTLASQCHSSTSCFWDWQGVMSRNAGNLMMTALTILRS